MLFKLIDKSKKLPNPVRKDNLSLLKSVEHHNGKSS